jgi:branched-chain amino acid transport system substrate-binding protein
MRNSRWLVVLVAALAALTIGACGDDDDGGGGGGDGGGEPIKIGASLPLTGGEFSEPGKAAQQGYKV